VAFAVVRSPFRYISVVLGVIALAGLVLVFIVGDANPVFSAIGNGEQNDGSFSHLFSGS
jgi:hypothetical protein